MICGTMEIDRSTLIRVLEAFVDMLEVFQLTIVAADQLS